MNNFLRNRKSTRDFKDKKLDNKAIDKILKNFKELEDELENKYFEFVLFEDGDKVYKGLENIGGYAGVMIKSPHYIGVRLKEVTDKSIINASFYTEKLMTKLTFLNLGSCWVNIKNVDKDIRENTLGIENKNIGYLVAFGVPKAKNPFIQEPTSSRHSVEEIVYKDEIGKPISIVELEGRGLDDLFYYIRFAPSNYNRQPWRFILENDKVTLLLKYSDKDKTDLMDAGIIMYYFKALAETIGIKNEWELVDNPDIEYKESKYKYIGKIKI